MEFENKSQNKTNRRIIYILVFTSIVLPVIVGVLVWHLTETSCSSSKLESVQGESDANTGNEQTTGPPNNATVSPPSVSEPWKNLRLPKHIIPIHYDITLYPDFYGDNGWFYGNESVEIQMTADTHVILIHINYMNVTKTVLRNNSTRQMIPIKEPFFYEENQFWVVETQQPVKAGESVVLELQFDGSLTRAIVGFYKSSYVNSVTNQIRYLASSKFQPVDARRAFPCFDEPNFKAEYTVSLVHRKGYIALSNMPARDTVTWPEDSSLDVTHFQRSVKMSTYLACFIVCDFGYLEGETKFGTKVRTYATPDRVNQTAYSLDIAVHTMERFQELFGVPYPLPKQDMIAIPDFVSGAMEHWGLITYRETNMLYDENEASPANKQRVAVVVAHEISHQWFGNIVTMDWWDDLWLNEGFASFIEYVGTNSAEPAWDMMDQFVTEDVQPVMITDSAVSSHPIIVDVNHPNQINEVFDAISYSKGASVIRMLESVMGQEDFYRGIGNFLETFKWGNAKTDDLWQKLNEVNKANFDVKPMMDSWTRQMGLPFVNVTFGEQNGQPKVTATQHRFLADMEMKYNESESPFKYRWYINMDYQTNDGIKGMFWINQTQDTVTVDVPVNPDTVTNAWIKFNNNQTGFYRVNYPSDIWKNFATTLQSNVDAISKVDKAGLIDDAFNLARGGYIEYDSPLDLTIYLRKETSHLPWESAYNGMGYLTSMLQTVGTFAKWSQYILSICKPVMESVGWDDTDGHLKKLMRVNLISLTCGMGDEECLQNATRIFRDWLDNGKSIPPNTRSLAYKFGMQNGGTSNDWDQMWQKYKTETVPQEQIKLLYGMAHTRHVWLLVRFLEYSKDESMVRSQDFFTVLQYIARNPVGKPLVWDWIRANWEYLVTRFTTYSRSLGRLVPAVISGFNTEFHLKEVEEFFAKFPDAGAGERGRIQALESIKRNIAWMKRNEMPISDWLCRHMSTC